MAIRPMMNYNSSTKYVRALSGVDKDGDPIEILLNDELTEILGIGNTSTSVVNYAISEPPDDVHRVRPADLDANFHSIYVYCDIIQPQYVGDTTGSTAKSC